MAQLIDLGKLRFDFKGNWDVYEEYEPNDVVKYGANVYVYTATTPSTSNPPTNTSYWTLMVEGIDFQGEYSLTANYKIGDIVTFGGKVYISNAANVGISPGINTGNVWTQLVDGIQFEGEYDLYTTYQAGDVVQYGANTYIANQLTTGNVPTNVTYWDEFVSGIKYFGEYNPATSYEINEIVTYDGSLWICLQPSTGDTPGDPSVYWDILVSGTFPSFIGNEGYFLSNNGSAVVWTADLAADSLDIGEAFYVGTGAKEFALDLTTDGEPLTNPVATFRFDSGSEDSSFAQLAFQNADPTSSTDIIAYMDNGSDSAGWMGIGITGSEFDDTTYGITAPGDGYIFLETSGDPGDFTGNMVFATGANGSENKIVFAAGGFDSGLTQMEITPDLNVHIEIPTPSTSPATGALTVVGGVGVQGDMNVAGNVNIAGEITFGGEGTIVETQNLAVSDPMVFTGSNNLADTYDLGLVGEYAEDVADQIRSVNNKSLTNNVATLQTTATHGYSAGDVVVITGVDATFNGTHVITETPTTTTFIFNKTAANVTSTAVSPVGTATVTHERRWGGVVRDVSDSGIIKFFQGLQAKPTTTVNFSDPGLSFSPIRAGAATLTSVSATNITTSGGTLNLGGTVNITSAANFTGSNVTLGSGTWSGTPTFNGAVVFSGTPSFTSGLTSGGNVTISGRLDVQEIREDFIDATISGNVLTADYNLSNIFYVPTAPAANFTVNLTNAPTDNGKTFTIAVIVVQGATGFYPNTFQVGGATPSGGTNGIRWVNNALPIPANGAGRIDVYNFSLVRRSNAWIVLGSSTTNFQA